MKIVDGWRLPDWLDSNPVVDQAFDVRVVEAALPFVRGRSVAVQGGARVGLWPLRLARYFQRVIAFEPEPRNWECCRANCEGLEQIEVYQAALWRAGGHGHLVVDKESDGLHHLDFAGDVVVATMTIDSLQLDHCDAIFLDVEGAELQALEGARKTLERFRPAIVAEENELCRRFGSHPGEIARWLKPFGYRVHGRYGRVAATPENPFPGWDLILCAD